MTDDTRERARQVARVLFHACSEIHATEPQWIDNIAAALVEFADDENGACERLTRKRAEQFYADQLPIVGDKHAGTADAIAARRKERK